MSAPILIVEDEEDLRTGVAKTLRARGHTVDEAGDGEEGLAKLLTSPYAVVVCDVAMPLMDGLDMLRAGEAAMGGARVLLLSAFAISDLPRELVDRGVNTLSKPIGYARVADEVEKLLR